MFEKLGDASYALYLIHPALISVARTAANKGYLAPASAPWLYLLGYIAICACASLAVHRLLEKPMTVAVRRVLSGWVSRSPRGDRLADREKSSIAPARPEP
jgi:peptidoglycan/LPS O-acetylase OafA/YrhL